MDNSTVKTDEILEILGCDNVSEAKKCLRKNKIPFYTGANKDHIFTTLRMIEFPKIFQDQSETNNSDPVSKHF